MSLPSSVTLVPVHAKIIDLVTGTPASGFVDFRVSSVLTDPVAHVTLTPGVFRGALDVNGEFTVELPATDDPDLTPEPWYYEVHVQTPTYIARFRATVPVATVGTLELDDMPRLPSNPYI